MNFEQLAEIRRLSALLIQSVNTAEELIPKLQQGLREQIDIEKLKKQLKDQHADIMRIDTEADELLNHKENSH